MDSCASISVRWKNGGVSPSALVRQQNNAKKDGIADQPEVTLWQVYSAQQIMDSDMRNTTANVVAVFGECEDITTKSMLYGAFPSNSDTQGCAVSSGLAFSLWGSTQVLGVQVRIEGEVFYVRGVFEDDNARVFRQAEFDKTLSNMQPDISWRRNTGGCGALSYCCKLHGRYNSGLASDGKGISYSF